MLTCLYQPRPPTPPQSRLAAATRVAWCVSGGGMFCIICLGSWKDQRRWGGGHFRLEVGNSTLICGCFAELASSHSQHSLLSVLQGQTATGQKASLLNLQTLPNTFDPAQHVPSTGLLGGETATLLCASQSVRDPWPLGKYQKTMGMTCRALAWGPPDLSSLCHEGRKNHVEEGGCTHKQEPIEGLYSSCFSN